MRMRVLAAAAVVISGAVHLKMYADWGHTDAQVGPAFLLNAVGGLVIGILLVTWHHWIPPLLAVGFGVATLGAFVIASTVGLFGVHEHWVGVYVWTAAVTEVVAIAAGATILWQEHRHQVQGTVPVHARHA